MNRKKGGIAQLGWLSKINKGLLILSATSWLSSTSEDNESIRSEFRYPRHLRSWCSTLKVEALGV